MIRKLVLISVCLVLAALVALRLIEAYQGGGAGQGSTSSGPRLPGSAVPGSGGNGAARRFGAIRPMLTVETAQVSRTKLRETIQLLGDLKPAAQVAVMAKASGRLYRLLVDRGDYVQKGQLIGQVEDQEIQQQVQRAEATLQVARAGLKQVEAEYQNLQAQLDRFQRLARENLVAAQDLENIQSRVRAADAQRELSRAQIGQAQAALNELKIQLSNTRMISPLSGFVSEKHLDAGALVNTSTPIVTILDLSTMKTVVNVTERDLPKVRTGLQAKVVVDAYPDRSFEGTISRISPMFDLTTRTAPVEIAVANSTGILKSGMFARVALILNNEIEGLTIPRDGLVTRGQRHGVFVPGSNGVEFVELEIGIVQDEKVQVLSGIKEGDPIVTRGAQSLNSGDQVRTAGTSLGKAQSKPGKRGD